MTGSFQGYAVWWQLAQEISSKLRFLGGQNFFSQNFHCGFRYHLATLYIISKIFPRWRCPHIHLITLIYLKVLLFSLTVFLSLKFAHPWTCITAFKDLHHSIRGPAWKHSRTCIRALASEHTDLHQSIQGPASGHPDCNLSGQLTKVKLIIDEIFISESTLSLINLTFVLSPFYFKTWNVR